MKVYVNPRELDSIPVYCGIEKARKGEQIGGQYIYRENITEKVTTTNGKKTVRRYNYYYAKDLIKDTAEKILENIGKFFFKGKPEEIKKIDESYTKENIQEKYGADKKTFFQHVCEYFAHRTTWDKRFSKKEVAKKWEKPVKMETADKLNNDGMDSPLEEKPEIKTNAEPKKKTEKVWKPNPSLMRKIWSMYTGKDQVKEEKKDGVIEDVINEPVKEEKKKTPTEILKEIKPLLRQMQIIPSSQIDATTTEMLPEVERLITQIQNMPGLYENETHTAYLHYFTGGIDYYICEFNPETGEAYGYTDNNGDPSLSEYGYIMLDELAKMDVMIGGGKLDMVNIDYYFTPKNVADCIKDSGHRELYDHYMDIFGEEEENTEEEIEETEAEKHENRSQAMMGNDNAKKYGLTDDDVSTVKRLVDKYNFTKEQFASSAARTGNIKSINDYAKEHGMKAYDVALDVYDIIINNKTEAVDETITERDTSVLSQAMMGNQNARKNNNSETSVLENYASGDGMWVNNYLRNPSLYESESGVLNETDKQFIADLDNATTTETITDKKLYRAVDASAVFGNISDLDFENLQASVVYGNKEKLYADKVDSLINGAMNKEITEKGFMSTTKDEEIAANWDGFTGSNKEVVMELNIPDGLTGKDMKDFDVEGDEQKEVLLPRNLDYKVTEITKGKNGKILVKADVLGVHGNHIAMLGNQNARKQGYTDLKRKEVENNLKPKIGKYTNESTGIEANFTGASIDKMSSSKAIEKSKANGFTVDEHFEVVNNILQLWKDAKLVETRPDKNGSTNLLSIKRFDADTVLSSGKNAVAHITVKESVQHGHKIYSVEVIDIEQKNNGQENPNRFNGGAELNQTSTSNENNITETKNVNTDTSKLSEAMKGNQNARKDGLTEDEQKQYQKEYDWYKETYVDGIREQNPYTNEEETIADILKDEADERYTVYGENDLGYKALKDLYTDTTGKEYTPTKKKMPKPQTESEMKAEQKKEKETRKKAGLPNPGNNVGDRVSAIDDADTWNPNSENYRFKDTGYIAGSRKEMASMFIMERAKNGTRIDAHEIDFDGLEENPRAAEKLITKSNIFGEVDWDGLREKGMSGSTAFLIDRIYASAGSKPDESNAQARKQYVIALNGLRDRFEDCKTVPEVIDTLKEIREEIRGEYVEIKEMPEYKKITDKMKSLNEIMRNKRNELMGLSEQGSKTYNVERQKIIEKYIQKGKDEKKLRWNTRVSEYNIPKEYQEEYKKETKGLWDKTYEPWKKAVEDFKAELISRGVKEEDFFTGKKNMAGKPIEVSWYDYYTLMPEAQEYGALSSELDAYIKKMKVAVSMKNPLLEAWKSLGKRFTDILYSDSFNQHKYECTKGTYDNWEWLEKEVKVTEKKTGKEKKRFQLKVANSITRKGGRDFNLTTTQDLKKAFNLREVQSGNWVLKDPTSAEFHVRNASNAFADLADVTGIGDDKISLNGRLAMAFGARGTGNAGGTTAMAHYEPVERVINLTKFKGGGCLGHEWFHAFDNMITSAMTGDNSIADVYLTNMYHGMTEANKLLLEEYVNLKDADSTYSNVYRKNQLKKQLEKKGVDVSEIDKSHKSALQIKVQNAFDDVVKAMTEGTEELMTTLTYEHKDYVNMISNMSDNVLQRYRDYYSSYSGDRKPMQLLIADAGSLDDAVRAINKRYEKYNDSKSIKNKKDWLKISAAYYDRKPDGTKGLQPLIIPSGKTGSQFLADAKDLDNQDGRAYWSETHEMAARAFSSYIEDTLQSMGRQNDYLAYASDNKYYGGDKPYPEGEERKRINAAFKKLFEVINSEQAIQKSIDILDNFIEKSEPRFIIKDGRFLVRK